MDLLADWLAVAGVRGTVGARLEASGDWGMRWDRQGDAVLYAITSGSAWIQVAGQQAAQLTAGDTYLVGAGAPHSIASGPGSASPVCDATVAALDAGKPLRLGTGGPANHILAARYSYDPAIRTQVLAALPPAVNLRADLSGSCLGDTVRLLARELAAPQAASAVVLDRLVDIILIQFLRVWLAEHPDDGPLLRVLSDPLVSEAIHLIHAEPARAWTTETLAAATAVSRATLARRFDTVLGMTPAAYLTQWRMDLAARRLRETDDPVDTIAHAVGYVSTPAFTRAFTRIHARPPGRYRNAARGQTSAPA